MTSKAFLTTDCSIFSPSSIPTRQGSTVSLSILVVIEMLNAMNALSSSESLMTMPLWKNMKLIYAITLSMVLHLAILYVPFLQALFSIGPLNWTEWQAVLLISAPVILIDEALKAVERAIYIQPAQLSLDMDTGVAVEKASNGYVNGKVKAN